jgi:outer membrane autotransporter protein
MTSSGHRMTLRKLPLAVLTVLCGCTIGATAVNATAAELTDTTLTGADFSYSDGLHFDNSELRFDGPTQTGYGAVLIRGAYTGANSRIHLRTRMDAGGSTVPGAGSDRVLINGDALGGPIALSIVNDRGPGAATDRNGNAFNDANEGISVAQVSGTALNSTFLLAGTYVAVGPYQYRLYAYAPGQSDGSQRVVDADADGHWDYRLQNAKAVVGGVPVPEAPGGANPVPPGDGSDGGSGGGVGSDGMGGSGDSRPALVPQAGAYLVHGNAVLAMGQHTLQSLHQRLGVTDGVHRYHATGSEVFARAMGGQSRYHSNLRASQFGYDYDQDWHGLQLGANWRVIDAEDHTFRLGLALNRARSQVHPLAVYGTTPAIDAAPIEVSRHQSDATALLATLTWQHRSGLYLDGVLGGSHYRSTITTPFRDGRLARLASGDVLASIEAGHRWRLSERVALEPQLQVRWQELQTDATTDADGVEVAIDNTQSLVWRVGARALLSTPDAAADQVAVTKYFTLNYVDSGGPASHATLAGTRFETGAFGRFAEASYGLTVKPHRGLSVYGDIAVQADLGDAGREGWALNVGAKWAF